MRLPGGPGGGGAAGLPQLRLNLTYTPVLTNARAEIVGQLFGQNYVYNSNLQGRRHRSAGASRTGVPESPILASEQAGNAA